MKKFITLMAAAFVAISANADTATFGSAQISGLEKDTDVPCGCFTIPGTYFAAGSSKVDVYDGDKGIKVRANKGEGGNEFAIAVNEGYTINSLSMGMVVNDANGTFTLAGIAVDGTAVADFTSVVLPNLSDASGAAVINLNDLKATQNIVFTYDLEGYEGKNKQVFIAGTVTYNEGGEEAGGAAFKWEPAGLNPYPGADIISLGALETVGFQVYEVDGIAITDVMPVWVDEDGNEIKALSGVQDPWGWNPNEFNYKFDTSAFKANGEYLLVFPEGMLVNAAGEKSEKIQTPYSFGIPELAPAMFDDFKILSIDPDLSQPQAIWNDQMMKINTNHNDAIGLTKLTITDTTTGDIVCTSSSFSVGRQLGDDAEISWEVTGPYKFFEGHTYRADIVFYNGADEQDYDTGLPTKVVDRVSYTFEGRVEAYKYSAVTLESVTPAPGAYMISDPSQAVFTYTFSGPVTVYQAYTPMGMNGQYDYPASCLSSNDEKTEWILDLSGNDFIKSLDSALPISIRARDLDGNQLQGNFGEEALSGFEYEWECELGAPAIEIVVPAYDTAVEKLTEVIVKSVDGNPISYQGYPAATIQSRNRQMLGELYLNPDAEASAEVRFTQWIPEGAWEPVDLDLSAEGIYSIVFPHGAFMFGEQFESKQSHSASTSFEVSNTVVTPPSDQATFAYVSVDPASGSNVSSLEKIVIVFPTTPDITEWTIDVYKEGEAEPVAVADIEYDPEDWNALDVNFRAPITADGTYTLTFKEGVIGDEAYIGSDGASGTCNPAFTLTYIVGAGSAVSSVEAAEADTVYYDLTGRRVLNPNKGIYIVGGKKVVK